jgi:hypothetical protein
MGTVKISTVKSQPILKQLNAQNENNLQKSQIVTTNHLLYELHLLFKIKSSVTYVIKRVIYAVEVPETI